MRAAPPEQLRQEAKAQMHRSNWKAAAALGFLFRHFDDAHRKRKLMHEEHRLPNRPAKRCQSGLAEADPSIIGRDLMIGPNCDWTRIQQRT